MCVCACVCVCVRVCVHVCILRRFKQSFICYHDGGCVLHVAFCTTDSPCRRHKTLLQQTHSHYTDTRPTSPDFNAFSMARPGLKRATPNYEANALTTRPPSP